MNIDLKGRRAVVGGATSGIGLGIARVLASCGAEICIIARNEKKLIETIDQLDKSNGQHHQFLVTDFLDTVRYKEDFQKMLLSFPADILVNNTQGPSAGGVMDWELQEYKDAFDLLFLNTVFSTTTAVGHMRQNKFGRIINVGSMTTKEPQDNLVLSNTMRTALVSWSKSLANVVGADGVTVNTILTGSFDTERLRSLMEQQAAKLGKHLEDVVDARRSAIPLGRLGRPEEFGYLIAFLASDYAAFVNGIAIPLDGGASVSTY